MLTGHKPFEEEDGKSVFRQIRDGRYIPIRKRQPDVPRALVSIVRKCLQINPKRRFSDVNELIVDLEKYLGTHICTRSEDLILSFLDGDGLLNPDISFANDWEKSCPGCNGLLDSINGDLQHLQYRVSFATVSQAPYTKLKEWATGRGWNHLRILSGGDTTFAKDYNAEYETKDWGNLHPIVNVFTKKNGKIYHTWASETFYVPWEQSPRHADMFWGLWNLLDITPDGRGDGIPEPKEENSAKK